MFGISGEHLLIIVAIFMLFGKKRLPEASRSVVKAIRNFKDSASGVQEAEYRHLDPKDSQNEKRKRTDA